ncbi:MAG: enoyl-CoA hydratase/isomerase family protein, partial [Deltaproteobacteria bacterium]
MSQYETIEITREGHLTWLALDRPEALNALSIRLVDELRDFFAGLAGDTETRVVVVRGKGRAFCSGLDLKEDRSGANTGGIAGRLRGQRHIAEIPMLMRRAPQPIIAAVHGAAAGGGFAIALAADVRIAGESAR